jgi:DNA-binding ferritin-like protein (Dps family)
MSKKQNSKKQPRKQRGGKVLGQGRDGCVVDPVFKCKNSRILNYDDKISKLINITNASKQQVQAFVDEFKIGQKFAKADPEHLMFLPGLDMCIMDDTNASKEQNDDLETCGYKHWARDTQVMNIIIKKGVDFDKVIPKLTEKQVLQSIGYLCSTALRYIYDMNITLMDIKPDNLLFTHSENYIYPVFIDFSEDFVLRGATGLSKFYSRGYPRPYFVWPLEVNSWFAPYGKVITKEMKDFAKYVEQYNRIDILNPSNRQALVDIHNYVRKSLSDRKQVKIFSEKLTCYMIGISVVYALGNKLKTYKKVEKIVNLMTEADVRKRQLLVDILNLIQQTDCIGDELQIKKLDVSNPVKKLFVNKDEMIVNKEQKAMKDNIRKTMKIVKSTKKESVKPQPKQENKLVVSKKRNPSYKQISKKGETNSIKSQPKKKSTTKPKPQPKKEKIILPKIDHDILLARRQRRQRQRRMQNQPANLVKKIKWKKIEPTKKSTTKPKPQPKKQEVILPKKTNKKNKWIKKIMRKKSPKFDGVM